MRIMASLTICAVLLLPLCGGCGSRKAEAEVLEPAMIISKEDASALTGATFGDCVPSEQQVVGLKLCVYENDQVFLQIGLTQNAFMPDNTKRDAKTLYTGIKEAFPDAEKIDGVGDDNFIAPPGLHILKGDYYLTLSLGLLNKDRENLKSAGMKAVENLEKIVQR